MDLKDSLKQFYNMSDEELEISFNYFLPETLPAKSYFLKEGKISDKLAYVKSGLLRSFIFNDNADDITTHFFMSGSVAISIYSFNHQVPSRENIIAIEDCDLLVITNQKMKELVQKVPAWKQIANDTDQYKFNQEKNRAIRFQTLSAKERYLQLMEKQPEIIQRVALKHIASYLGIDIATLSRLRKKI